MNILDRMRVFPAMINMELRRYLPFLVSGIILAECIVAGMGRQTAHERIKDHAVAAVEGMREHGSITNDFFDRVAADGNLPMTRDRLEEIVHDPMSLTGTAMEQVAEFAGKVRQIVERHPDSVSYKPSTFAQ
jgi:adenylosuccinate lyase